MAVNGKLCVRALTLAVLLLSTALCSAGTEKVLFRFNYTNGSLPDYGPIVMDSAGNIFGTTDYGGDSPNCTLGCGTVFELKPGANGRWTETVIHSFSGNPDGANPFAGLAMDAAGNLYGITAYGGTATNCTSGCGTVFELSPDGTGRWREHILYSFKGTPDGSEPDGALALDSAGNVYGTTYFGGASPNCTLGCGTVFKLQPALNGRWSERVLYSFTGTPDGANPWAVKPVQDAAGNIYGTTYYGGDNTNCTTGCGTVFELSPTGGKYTEKVLHSFTAFGDGSLPIQGVIFDSAGNLFGTTVYGGDFTNCTLGCGVAYELTPSPTGGWTENSIYTFNGVSDGVHPGASLIFDAAGNLYGTAFDGGNNTNCTTGCGIVYELSPNGGSNWTETTLHAFTSVPDGAHSSGSLIIDSAGNLYGTTFYGGNATNCLYGCGTVFEVVGASADK